MERLQKVMAHAGVASRRACEELIRAGRVRVNGEPVTELGRRVDPQRDRIQVNGREIRRESKRYFLFYKPKGVITSVTDPRGRRVVTDFFREVDERVYPVGRLDYETEGLLLLTNDGELANRLAHPRHEVDKVYQARVADHPGEESLERLRKGIRLEDGWTAPAKVRVLESAGKDCWLEIVIHEGRNRQVRRMLDAIGHPVRRLIRTRIDFLTLAGLKPGRHRSLKQGEVERLRERLGD
ncbi:pseudouridine synthase [Desmospora profundinema]|uniref:Pseudouridine synthase n=1 Tax=Desmospora profundinema TaxID=1571184 RepID=A0ABU1IIF0_9BACL|nr:pseudouridine synthase [Desmospora profundinema]MDR6224548.1 23S rRNA pseudouridine2605 synthase [Desmospora profundinema]